MLGINFMDVCPFPASPPLIGPPPIPRAHTTQCEELSRGEHLLSGALPVLEEDRLGNGHTLMQAYNQLGVLWSGRGEYPKALESAQRHKYRFTPSARALRAYFFSPARLGLTSSGCFLKRIPEPENSGVALSQECAPACPGFVLL